MSNIIFLVFFLPFSFLIYIFSGENRKDITLLISSVLFTLFSGIEYCVTYIILSLLVFIFGKIIKKSSIAFIKNIIFVIISLMLSALMIFVHLEVAKTIDLISYNIIYPIGMSFFILRSIMFLNDCRKNNIIFEIKFTDCMLYLLYFPSFILGPIVSFDYFIALLGKSNFSYENMGEGFSLFVTGFIQKILIADYLYKFIYSVFKSENSSISCVLVIYTAIAFFLYIYFLFESYSNMAEGMSLIFGIRLPKNNFPYFMCDTFSDFGKKWNVTAIKSIERSFLGNSISKISASIKIIAVWLIYGIWFGCNLRSALFGLIVGIIIAIEYILGHDKITNKNILRRIMVFLVLSLLIILLMPVSFENCIDYFKALICYGYPIWNDSTSYYIEEYFFIILVAFVFALNMKKNYVHIVKNKVVSGTLKYVFICFKVVVFVIALSVLVSHGGNSSVEILI